MINANLYHITLSGMYGVHYKRYVIICGNFTRFRAASHCPDKKKGSTRKLFYM